MDNLNKKRLYGEMDPHLVNTQDFKSKFRSKEDLYSYLEEQCKHTNRFKVKLIEGQYYLPPINAVNKDFLK